MSVYFENVLGFFHSLAQNNVRSQANEPLSSAQKSAVSQQLSLIEQEIAATTIQSRVRSSFAQKELTVLKKEESEKQAAACTIQSFVRKSQAQTELERLKEEQAETQAALKLQSGIRMLLAQQMLKKLDRCPYAPALIASISARRDSDRAQAIENLKDAGIWNPEEVADRIAKIFEDAPMTTNIDLYTLFSQPNSTPGVLHYFQRKERVEEDLVHSAKRDKVERSLFGIDNQVVIIKDGQGQIVDHTTLTTHELGEVRKNGGTAVQNGEESDHRPVYAGVNFMRKAEGAAFGYGSSVFTFSDSLKPKTTILGQDSFDVDANGQLMTEDKLGTFTNTYAVINGIASQRDGPQKLRDLCDATNPQQPDPYAFVDYIECHVHTSVSWDKITNLRADAGDILDKTFNGQLIKRLPFDEQKQIIRNIHQNIVDFSNRTGVHVEFENFDRYIH